MTAFYPPGPPVALRKESVDRNYIIKVTGIAPRRSLSARRAWIEIPRPSITGYFLHVALRKESVDRNSNTNSRYLNTFIVALRKESVDRNLLVGFGVCLVCGRSPQGERG